MTVEQNEAREESRRIIAEQAALIRQLGEAFNEFAGCCLPIEKYERAQKAIDAYNDWKARQS
jgi:hypothetical protein